MILSTCTMQLQLNHFWFLLPPLSTSPPTSASPLLLSPGAPGDEGSGVAGDARHLCHLQRFQQKRRSPPRYRTSMNKYFTNISLIKIKISIMAGKANPSEKCALFS